MICDYSCLLIGRFSISLYTEHNISESCIVDIAKYCDILVYDALYEYCTALLCVSSCYVDIASKSVVSSNG